MSLGLGEAVTAIEVVIVLWEKVKNAQDELDKMGKQLVLTRLKISQVQQQIPKNEESSLKQNDQFLWSAVRDTVREIQNVVQQAEHIIRNWFKVSSHVEGPEWNNKWAAGFAAVVKQNPGKLRDLRVALKEHRDELHDHFQSLILWNTQVIRKAVHKLAQAQAKSQPQQKQTPKPPQAEPKTSKPKNPKPESKPPAAKPPAAKPPTAKPPAVKPTTLQPTPAPKPPSSKSASPKPPSSPQPVAANPATSKTPPSKPASPMPPPSPRPPAAKPVVSSPPVLKPPTSATKSSKPKTPSPSPPPPLKNIIFIDSNNTSRSVIAQSYMFLVREWTSRTKNRWPLKKIESAGLCVESGSAFAELLTGLHIPVKLYAGNKVAKNLAINALFDQPFFNYQYKAPIRQNASTRKSRGLPADLFSRYDYILVFKCEQQEILESLRVVYGATLSDEARKANNRAKIQLLGNYNSPQKPEITAPSVKNDPALMQEWQDMVGRIKTCSKAFLTTECGWKVPEKKDAHLQGDKLVS